MQSAPSTRGFGASQGIRSLQQRIAPAQRRNTCRQTSSSRSAAFPGGAHPWHSLTPWTRFRLSITPAADVPSVATPKTPAAPSLVAPADHGGPINPESRRAGDASQVAPQAVRNGSSEHETVSADMTGHSSGQRMLDTEDARKREAGVSDRPVRDHALRQSRPPGCQKSRQPLRAPFMHLILQQTASNSGRGYPRQSPQGYGSRDGFPPSSGSYRRRNVK
jgi:hypothetical protein